MVKRCIGIDIGSSYLCAAQLSQADQLLCIEKVYSVPLHRSTDSLPDILKTLISQQGFDRRADIAISLPHDAVFFRNLETDSAGAQQIHALSGYALEHNFPIQPDEIVVQECSRRQLPDEKCSVLMAAVKKESLYERLNTLTEAKMHPNRIEAMIFAVHSTVIINHPEIMTGRAIIAYINEFYLTFGITQDNDILIVRSIPIVSCSDDNIPIAQEQVAEVLSCEAEITWRKAFGEEVEKNTTMYLAIGGNASDDLKIIVEENLSYQVIIVDPYAKVQCPAEYNNNAKISVAEGLALGLLAPDKTTSINFLEADNSNIKPALNLKKEFVICAILLAAITIVSLGGLFMRLSHLETKYSKVNNEIRKIFQRTLPNETNIVNPAAQLTQKLEVLRKDYRLFASFGPTSLSPLKVLRGITTSTPSDGNVKVNNLLITAESVRLSGYCDSFESVYQWQQLLQEVPEFTIVDVQDAQREAESGAVHFTMLISSAGLPAISEQK